MWRAAAGNLLPSRQDRTSFLLQRHILCQSRGDLIVTTAG